MFAPDSGTNFSCAKPRVVRILAKLMFVFLAIYPFGIATVLGVKKAIWSFAPASSLTVLVYAGTAAVIFVLLCLCSFFSRHLKTKASELTLVTVLALAAFFLRVYAAVKLHPQPVSDFALCYEFATAGSHASMMALVPYNAFYSSVLRLLFSIFGNSLLTAQVFHALLAAAVSVLLYFTVINAFASKQAALFAACLYVFYPSLILYSTITSTENVSAFFFCGMLFFLSCAYKKRTAGLSTYCKCFLSALCCLSITNLFKPIGTLMLIALFAVEFLWFVIPCIFSQKKVKKKTVLDQLSKVAITVCAALMINALVTVGGNFISSKVIGFPVGKQQLYSASSIGNVAYFGLSPVGNGTWNTETKATLEYVQDHFSPQEGSRYLMEKLIGEIKNAGPAAFFRLLAHKIDVSWADEWVFGYYATRSGTTSAASIFDTPFGFVLFYVVPCAFTLGLNLGVTAYYVFSLCSKRTSSAFQIFSTCFLGIISISFLILEAQTRYKSSFLPLFCILAALGLSKSAELCGLGKKLR